MLDYSAAPIQHGRRRTADGAKRTVQCSGSRAQSVPPSVFRLPPSADRRLCVLGVEITDVTRHRAIELLEEMIWRYHGRDQRFASATTPAKRCPVGARGVFFVNAHTLNLAAADPEYRAVLRGAAYVFGDGTGVRWAGYLQGLRVQDNLAGTDFVPQLFRETANRGYRYFLLGSDRQTIRRAAVYAAETFPGWGQAGYHHGYLTTADLTARVIRQINRARPDVLLVGMGNPTQERWIHHHQHLLRLPVCMGIGGLFDYWAGNVTRAPQWLRSLGHEWVWRLWQQPADKAKRYLVGNPRFLMRILWDASINRRRPSHRPYFGTPGRSAGVRLAGG
jgi:N-acetylglucosaminyldiphosphoundecaprenol N-acetyl-beta-D-mannosaminyltransferase